MFVRIIVTLYHIIPGLVYLRSSHGALSMNVQLVAALEKFRRFLSFQGGFISKPGGGIEP